MEGRRGLSRYPLGLLVGVGATSILLALGGVCFGKSSEPNNNNHSRFKRVLLDKGTLPSYRWRMLAHRDRGREGARRPCISVVILHKAGSFGVLESDFNICGSLPRGGPPEILSYPFDDGANRVTIFALAFERRVATVRLDLGEAGVRTVHLHALNKQQAANAGLQTFRFRTFAVRGPLCTGEVQGFSDRGKEIYRSPPEPCAEAD